MINYKPIQYLYFDSFVVSIWMLMFFFGILISCLLGYFYCKKSKDLDETKILRVIASFLLIIIFIVFFFGDIRVGFGDGGGIILLFIFLFTFFFLKYNKMGVEYLDVLGFSLPLGLAFIRLGAFLINEGHGYGLPTILPWGVSIKDSVISTHPVYFYLFLLNLIVFLILFKLKDVDWFKSRKGSIFLMYLMTYSLPRALFIEPLRFYHDNFSQQIIHISVLYSVFIISLLVFMNKYLNKKLLIKRGTLK